ncbi:uncharacterized protein LOC143018913 [Oratosquilla oratoria]|uniref:uncharacterized protein LOC143018913 n=1 Tax=Oratosquilla oratoria TaxID=337810 RepID=UPI003F777215
MKILCVLLTTLALALGQGTIHTGQPEGRANTRFFGGGLSGLVSSVAGIASGILGGGGHHGHGHRPHTPVGIGGHTPVGIGGHTPVGIGGHTPVGIGGHTPVGIGGHTPVGIGTVGHGHNTGHGSHGGSGSSSCRYWCNTPEGAFYCCEDARRPTNPFVVNIVKPGRCPPVRPICPRFSGAPITCSKDGDCGGVDKCCFDRCLGEHVCKPPL